VNCFLSGNRSTKFVVSTLQKRLNYLKWAVARLPFAIKAMESRSKSILSSLAFAISFSLPVLLFLAARWAISISREAWSSSLIPKS